MELNTQARKAIEERLQALENTLTDDPLSYIMTLPEFVINNLLQRGSIAAYQEILEEDDQNIHKIHSVLN